MNRANDRLPVRIERPGKGKSHSNTLHGVSNCPHIRAAADVATAFCPIAGSEPEIFVAGLLDTRSRLIAWQIVSVGSKAKFTAKVPELFGLILGKEGHQVVFAFSGTGTVSTPELDHAEDILSAAAILGVAVLDVVRITPHGYQSLKSLLEEQQKGRTTIALASACA